MTLESTPPPPPAATEPLPPRPWYRLHCVPLLLGAALLIWLAYLNVQEQVVEDGIRGNSFGWQRNFESKRGFPNTIVRRAFSTWVKHENGIILPASRSRNCENSVVEFVSSGLRNNLILALVLVGTVIATGEWLYRQVPIWYVVLRALVARRLPRSTDDSSDGEPESPAWDEAKNR